MNPPVGNKEIEIKFSLARDAVRWFRSSPLLRGAVMRRSMLDNVYFDTPDRLLHTHGVALRLRHDGVRWWQTVKSSGPLGVFSRRGEWEQPAALTDDTPTVDFARLADSPLPALLDRHSATAALEPVVRTRFLRTHWRCRHRTASIEVALDVGEISTLGSGDAYRVEPICEVELELLRGEPAAMVDFARELLAGRRAARWQLLPAVESKGERGFRLADQRPLAVTKAAAQGFVAQLHAELPAAHALRAFVRHGAAVIAANAEALRIAGEAAHVHQARVALRRMRSAIRLLDSGKKDFPSALAMELKTLASTLGRARDWDVLAEQTLPNLPALDATAHEALTRAVQAQSKRARKRAIAAVSSAQFARLVVALEAWVLTAPPRTPPLGDRAEVLLTHAAHRLFDRASGFEGLSPRRRHRVRILAKRLRYALDLLSVALPALPTRRYIDALAQLQDVLGELNDAAVALERLRSIDCSKAARKEISRWVESTEATLVHDAVARIAKLESLPRPWLPGSGKDARKNGAK